MKTKFYLFILIISILCLAADCTKEPKEYPTYYMSQEFKDYVLFPVGSFWVYQNTSSGIEDSIFLFKQEIKIMEAAPNEREFNCEVFEQNFYSSVNETLIGGGGVIIPGAPDVYHLSKEWGFYYQFFAPASVGDMEPHYKILKYVANYDTLNINGNNFYEIRVFENLKQYNNQPKKFYYARNVGLIKIELFDGTIWEIKKYFINE